MNVILPEGYEPISLPFFNEWIEALESGKFEQGRGRLFSGTHYCCLGVLSKVQCRLTEKGRDTDVGHDMILHSDNPCFNALGNSGSFPEGVYVERHPSGPKGFALVYMNDTGYSFHEIAEAIKKIWKP